MGNSDSRLNFRKAVIQLTTKTQPVEATDDAFWAQFWADTSTSVQDMFALVPAAEIRAVREESPSNLATLCYKAVEKLAQTADSGCRSVREQQVALSCSRLLTRVLPYIFEDPDWRGFFWATVPGAGRAGADGGDDEDDGARPLAEFLLLAIADLLFCPDFTVQNHRRGGPDSAEDIQSVDSCEHIWEAGVGFAQPPPLNYTHDLNRVELLKLLLTCFSEAMYLPPSSDPPTANPWVSFFCSAHNRHALPLFTSLLNAVCAYDPVGYGIPYNHLLFSDSRERLVGHALQALIVTLETEGGASPPGHAPEPSDSPAAADEQESVGPDNLFVNYLSRIHREEDFSFILKGVARLLTNPLTQTYLPNSTKKIQFHQELLVLFWKLCDFNKKFLFFVLKSSHALDILLPILYYLNEARSDQSRVGLMHIGVFILLLLSGERNFGVRLNKPYTERVSMDVPVFTGTHADLLIIVFHRIITSGHQRLQPLFDCLLTIVVNVSPYLKSLSMVAANKLLHLVEAFSTPWFLVSAPQNHHLIFFLLEAFNNLIQYQFDGNSNLVYAIIRKRAVFHQLANLHCDPPSLQRALQRKKRSPDRTVSMEASRPAVLAGPGTINTSLAATPGIDKLTEQAQVSQDGTMVSVQQADPVEAPPIHPEASDTEPHSGRETEDVLDMETETELPRKRPSSASSTNPWVPTPEWVLSWKVKLPLQTIMRLLQVLVPQVEKICIDKGLTDESEILKFLQHGTLVGLLPVPHPILIRKYQANAGTSTWFRTYMWGVVYLRNVDPPIWYDTDVRLFEIQRV
ncbi:protein HID1-like [Conger conger]|uniref:protein HID1-like n=1 Tax=Conger conger TaxID=82655 RepID=UPI002A59D9CF|nr:protein HID1-like [Conger conger]